MLLELDLSSVRARLLLNLGTFPAIISTYFGQTLTNYSPGSILIAYTSVGLLVYIVMTALGEMAAWIPHSSGFAGYATRFCDPCLGFALGWTYWCKYIITTPNQLTASALIIQEWKSADEVNPGVWVAVFLVTVILINYFGIKFFGELEFWLSSIKVVTIVCFVNADDIKVTTDHVFRLESSSFLSSSLSALVQDLPPVSSTTRNLVLSRSTLTRALPANSTASGPHSSMPSLHTWALS